MQQGNAHHHEEVVGQIVVEAEEKTRGALGNQQPGNPLPEGVEDQEDASQDKALLYPLVVSRKRDPLLDVVFLKLVPAPGDGLQYLFARPLSGLYPARGTIPLSPKDHIPADQGLCLHAQ
ncbi:MAG: hypothetical protein MUP30_12100 [Deltaproteobacteria bacterium]|nr:hypothetical protein [Deltaproteobacteria bacterium]